MEKVFAFDRITGYKWGTVMWLSFFVPSFVTLLCDYSSVGREYLAFSTLFSCLTFAVYCYYFYEGRPASTPSQVGITAEALARWVLAAYYGPHLIVHSGAVGVMNGILLVASGLFAVQKLGVQIYVHFNQKAYLEYEKKETDAIMA